MNKILVLRTLGFGDGGTLILAGDEAGQYHVFEWRSTFGDLAAAQSAFLADFYQRVERLNRAQSGSSQNANKPAPTPICRHYA